LTSIRSITTYQQTPLQEAWQLLSVAPNLYQTPEQLKHIESGWLSATVPGTVIATLQQYQQWDLSHPINTDATDWWYRCTFNATLPEPGQQIVLKFGGLATIADVWLNGQHILYSDNMFCSYDVDITALLATHNELYIRFSSLQSQLSAKRPRPRWRTQLVDHQQLRWFRTTLLGKMPGWSPPIRPVGLWQPVCIEERTLLSIEQLHLQTTLADRDGHISLRLQARSLVQNFPKEAVLIVGDVTFPLHVQRQASSGFILDGEISLPTVQQWWPHTYGSQPLYPAKIVIQYAEATIEVDCGRLAFRHVEFLHGHPHDFGLRFNGLPIFCRGACWTPLDMITLTGSKEEYTETLQLAQRAGMNMLRVGGTMVYEADVFYDLCDELGILVWQDFMFANMDYPTTNEAFQLNCVKECAQLLARLQTHPCLTLLCGNSEIEQQVAMLGLPAEMWHSEFFHQVLPRLCATYIDIPYWPSSPSGGTHPFQSNTGNAHYQGVGPFLRPLEDARRSEVRFATECLGFANVPEDQTLDLFLKPGEVVAHHPKWKARSPRDYSSGWDFDDIRDYYLELLFHVDPMKLRYSDTQRYLELSRVTSGEVMAYVFAEWRRQRSTCHGGLIWFYRDLWPGAGWGLIDSTGYPKAAYYYLRRVLLPQTCFFSDEGLNGLWLHIINDTEAPTAAELRLSLYRFSGPLMATVTKELLLPPREEAEIHVDALFEGFRDLTYAYRFGPPGYDVAVAKVNLVGTGLSPVREGAPHADRTGYNIPTTDCWTGASPTLAEAFYFPQGLPATHDADIGLSAQATLCPDGTYELRVRTEKFAQSVAIRAEHFLPEDNYFHLQPGGERTFVLCPRGGAKAFHCSVSALNTRHEIDI
jgi:beta-mannosidase